MDQEDNRCRLMIQPRIMLRLKDKHKNTHFFLMNYEKWAEREGESEKR